MAISTAILDALLEAGATAEMIVAVVKAEIAADERRSTEKRANDAERKRRARKVQRERRPRPRRPADTAESGGRAHETQHLASAHEAETQGQKSPHTPLSINSLPSSNLDSEFLARMGGRYATRPSVSDDFEEFWKAYPRRDGPNPKAPARIKFLAIVKSGTPAANITEAARRYTDEMRSTGGAGTRFVAQAITWLNQQRWSDYQSTAPPDAALQPPPGAPTHEELMQRYSNERSSEGVREVAGEDQEPGRAGVSPQGNGGGATGEWGGLRDQAGHA